MKRALVLSLVLGMVLLVSGCWLVPDRWQLNGTWEHVDKTELRTIETRLTFDGDRFEMRVRRLPLGSEDFAVSDGRQGTYVLNTGTQPKSIDVHQTRRYVDAAEGIWVGTDEDFFGIYEILDSDHIRVEFNFEGDRPNAFGEDAMEYTRLDD